MMQIVFNAFLASLLLIPAAALLCRGNRKLRALPALSLMLTLLTGAMAAESAFGAATGWRWTFRI